MGYFSNGSQGADYETKYCDKCVHSDSEKGCAVMFAHMLHNYEECNNKDSILHELIPRDENGDNLQCTMFIEQEIILIEREEVNMTMTEIMGRVKCL